MKQANKVETENRYMYSYVRRVCCLGRVCYFAEVFAYLLILFTALDFKMQGAAVAENLCCFQSFRPQSQFDLLPAVGIARRSPLTASIVANSITQ